MSTLFSVQRLSVLLMFSWKGLFSSNYLKMACYVHGHTFFSQGLAVSHVSQWTRLKMGATDLQEIYKGSVTF